MSSAAALAPDHDVPRPVQTVDQATGASRSIRIDSERSSWEAPDSVAQPAIGVPVLDSISHAVTPNRDAPPLILTMAGEREEVEVTSKKLVAMVSLKAPAALDDGERPAIDLVACIDKSGSMHGSKMGLMKQTLELLVRRSGFGHKDRLALVTFDASVKVELPLSCMSAAGRSQAENVVKSVRPGSTTNLSGGVLKAIDVLSQAPSIDSPGGEEAKPKRTRAVMLFTDGMANNGITETRDLVAAVSAALAVASVGGPVSLYTFGFGADHDENCLRQLATDSGANGLYYSLSGVDDIPTAFADCLGGLTSIVAQNAVLSLQPEGGSTISRVLGNAYPRDADGNLVLGDLFSEDEKDLLVELALPALAAPAGPAPILRSTLRAFNVARLAPETVHATLEVSRPEVAPTDQQVNLSIDAQRNRIETAEALEKATRLADAGDLDGGRRTLRDARRNIADSASADQKLSADLVREYEIIEQQFETTQAYRSAGSKASKMQIMSHSRQRAVHTNAHAYMAGAERKAALKSAWMSSMKGKLAGSAADCDSD